MGGGSRKVTKRSSNPKKSTSSKSTQEKQEPLSASASVINTKDQDGSLLEIGGTFSSLLEVNNGQFGNMIEGLNSSGSPSLQLGDFSQNQSNSGLGSSLVANPFVEFGNNKDSEGFLGVQHDQDSSSWSGTNGDPDLAMYTPGSSFSVDKSFNL